MIIHNIWNVCWSVIRSRECVCSMTCNMYGVRGSAFTASLHCQADRAHSEDVSHTAQGSPTKPLYRGSK